MLIRKRPGHAVIDFCWPAGSISIGHNGKLSTTKLIYKDHKVIIVSLWILGIFLQYTKGISDLMQ